MEESFVSACELRTLFHRKQGVQLHSDEDGIEHLAFCIARVNVASLDLYCGSGGIEVLVFEFPHSSAVHRVCIACTEFLHIEFDDTPSDLLIRCEAYLYLSVLEFRVFYYILYGIHDFCHSSLVVRAEKGCSVSGDYCLPLVVKQFREVTDLKAQSFNSLKGNIRTVVITDDLRLDVGS